MTTAALAAGNLTLRDLVSRELPDGSIDQMITELLTQWNSVVEHATFREGNIDTGHEFTSRTALPSVGYRKYNQGIASTKSRTDQFVETCGRIEAWSVVDKALADRGGKTAEARLSEDKAFISAMANEFESGFFANSTKNSPEKWMGLAPRLSATTDTAGGMIVLWGGSSSGNDQASVWEVGFGNEQVFCITPRGQPSGLQHIDHGFRPWLDGSSNPFTAYLSEFHWTVGVCVKDWRYVSRLANVDTSAITATGFDVLTGMVQQNHKMFKPAGEKRVYFCNRVVGTYLHLQAMTRALYQIKLEEVDGKMITTFLGHPVALTDGLTSTESVLS